MGLMNWLAQHTPFGGAPSARDQLLASLPSDSVGAEIGVWKGRFSLMVTEKLQPKSFHLIDPWAFQPDFSERMYGGRVARNQADMDAIFEGVQQLFDGVGNVHFHRDFSSEAVKAFDDGYFDWVYIDGNHHYDYVMEDLRLYFPKIKPGGYIAGDDYTWAPRETPGDLQVKRAVADFLTEKDGAVKMVNVWDDQFLLRR